MGWMFARVVAGLMIAAGLLCGGFGFWQAILDPRSVERAHTEASQLPVVTTAAQLTGDLVGRRVLVAGRIAPGNPGLDLTNERGEARRFVIYRRTRLEAKPPDRNGVRVVNHIDDKPVTPALTIALPDGSARVTNDDYRFTFPLGGGVAPSPDSWVIGFVEGGEALVDGTVVQGADGPALRARFIHPEVREGYLEGLRGDPSTRGLSEAFGGALICLALPALLAGLAGLFAAWWLPRR